VPPRCRRPQRQKDRSCQALPGLKLPTPSNFLQKQNPAENRRGLSAVRSGPSAAPL
jgi:hypothetical protein